MGKRTPLPDIKKTLTQRKMPPLPILTHNVAYYEPISHGHASVCYPAVARALAGHDKIANGLAKSHFCFIFTRTGCDTSKRGYPHVLRLPPIIKARPVAGLTQGSTASYLDCSRLLPTTPGASHSFFLRSLS